MDMFRQLEFSWTRYRYSKEAHPLEDFKWHIYYASFFQDFLFSLSLGKNRFIDNLNINVNVSVHACWSYS